MNEKPSCAEPEIIRMKAKTLVGMSVTMSLAEDTTRLLWQRFMPRRHEIADRVGEAVFDLKRYDAHLTLSQFTPQTRFEKWAAVEVNNEVDRQHEVVVPEGMAVYELEEGDYAVFQHRGPAATFGETRQFIFSVWMPASGYVLDSREHFEILQPGYRPDDPEAEEEVWIPIKQAQE